jgi:hypothetical protein
MRLLAALMTSISLVTTALFAHALATVDEQRPTPQIARAASR